MVDQLNLFPPAASDPVGVDVGAVRTELLDVLDRVRSDQVDATWDEKTQRYWRTVFPQMARWLPRDEGAVLCARFDAAMIRRAVQPRSSSGASR